MSKPQTTVATCERFALIIESIRVHVAASTSESRRLCGLLAHVLFRYYLQLPNNAASRERIKDAMSLIDAWLITHGPGFAANTDLVGLLDSTTIARELNEFDTTDGIVFYLDTLLSDLRKEVRGE